jgi:hypothetical protein
MKSLLTLRATAVALVPILLAACGSSHDDAPTTPALPVIKVTELAAGAYAVSAGDAADPVAGKYYAAADGSRLLVLNNSAQQASAAYRRDGNGAWQRWPAATADSTLDLLDSGPIPVAALTIAPLARSYAVRLDSGGVALFAVSAGGDITAGASTCKLSGKLAVSPLPGALKLTLATSGCGDLPAQADGVLVADSDYAPAAFRLLASGSKAPVDLWAYPE